jgi:large subunit ribosomal protein L22
MAYKYSFEKYDNETMARASGSNLNISLKKSVETLREIRGKKVSSAIKFLEAVIEQKAVVPYRRYKAEMAHKRGKGVDTGGYPVSVAKEVLRLLKSAQKNAEDKELDSENLYVISASCRKGATRYHYGRFSGRKMKSTNVEIIVGERDKK